MLKFIVRLNGRPTTTQTTKRQNFDYKTWGEPNANGEIEIGYGTYDEFQGKGFLTEIVGGIIEWTKNQ